MTSTPSGLMPLNNRQVIKVSGEDRYNFLQGLLTNDIHLLDKQDSLYACMLTPQGKFLYDFFIFQDGADIYLDTEKDRAAEALKRLTMYKLRAKVTLALQTDFNVYACFDNKQSETAMGDFMIKDPRHEQAGSRFYSQTEINPTESFDLYDQHRLQLGLLDGARDMEIERTTMAEARMDQQNGVCYTKGCYVGQEITARMHHRGLAKKQLFPIVKQTGVFTDEESQLNIDDKNIGQIKSVNDQFAIVLLRLIDYDLVKNDNKYRLLA